MQTTAARRQYAVLGNTATGYVVAYECASSLFWRMDILLERFAGEEFEEGANVLIHQWTATRTGLTLALDIGSYGLEQRERWIVECETVRECRLGWGLAYSIELLTDDVLLTPYLDPLVTLATRGPVPDVTHALGDLWQAHWGL